jgi:hypothetical protein
LHGALEFLPLRVMPVIAKCGKERRDNAKLSWRPVLPQLEVEKGVRPLT